MGTRLAIVDQSPIYTELTKEMKFMPHLLTFETHEQFMERMLREPLPKPLPKKTPRKKAVKK